MEHSPSQPPGTSCANSACDCSAESAFSRRSFIKTMGLSAAATAAGGASTLGRPTSAGASDMVTRVNGVAALGPDAFPIKLTVNGQAATVQVDGGTTLLEALRWRMNITGPKPVCDRGACGACSVLLDGKLVTSCMILAVDAVGRKVTTIEGLGSAESPDPLQTAFVRHDAAQCGFCTPGLVLASKALLDANPKPTLAEIKAGLAGNLCRCGTYTNVFNAVLDASGQSVPVDLA